MKKKVLKHHGSNCTPSVTDDLHTLQIIRFTLLPVEENMSEDFIALQ